MPSVATLDRLTRRATAFTSYADMVYSCREHGYVPTLRVKSARGRVRPGVRIIGRALERDGYRVWWGR